MCTPTEMCRARISGKINITKKLGPERRLVFLQDVRIIDYIFLTSTYIKEV